MKRKDALAHIRIAGYHGDQKTKARIYVENRISLHAANEAYAEGERLRRQGMKCSCHDCNDTTTKTTE